MQKQLNAQLSQQTLPQCGSSAGHSDNVHLRATWQQRPPQHMAPTGDSKKCHSVRIAWTSGAATAKAIEDPHPLLRIQDCRVAVPRSWGTGSRDFVPSVGLTISCRDFCRQLRNGKHAVPQNTLSTHLKRTKHMSCQDRVVHATASGNVMGF